MPIYQNLFGATEAKTQLCPMMPRDVLKEHVGGGFLEKVEYPSLCRGDACMMWRWIKAETSTENDKLRGFCGLAGTPWDAPR